METLIRTYYELLGQFYQNQECNYKVCSIRSAEWQIARSAHLTAPATTEPASVNFYKFLVAPSWESRHGMWALSEVELASLFVQHLIQDHRMLVPSLSSPGSVVSSTHYHWLILPPLWPQVTASSGLELLTAPRLCSLPQSPALPWTGRHGPAPVSSAPAIVKLSETDTTRHYPILSGASIQQGRALWYHSILKSASVMGWPI